tara:strand:- start:1954 stop:2178 length:225 start_codon:yes stop_codon:yes gene_type:complete
MTTLPRKAVRVATWLRVEDPLLSTGWEAKWVPNATKGLGILGCPVGAGDTEEEAVRDLICRTNAESKLNLKVTD